MRVRHAAMHPAHGVWRTHECDWDAYYQLYFAQPEKVDAHCSGLPHTLLHVLPCRCTREGDCEADDQLCPA